MTQDEMKKQPAGQHFNMLKKAALAVVVLKQAVNRFIDALGTMKGKSKVRFRSSVASTEKLEALEIKVFECNDVFKLDIYVDGADEINGSRDMIKGGGAALAMRKNRCRLLSDDFYL